MNAPNTDVLLFQGREIVAPFSPMPLKNKPAARAVSLVLRNLPREVPLLDDILFWLFYWHPRRDEKLNRRKIDHFVLRNFRGSYIPLAVMNDGCRVDFSYSLSVAHFCGSGDTEQTLAKQHRRNVVSAFRHAITPDIQLWKLLNAHRRPCEDAQVDHVYPYTFSFLMDSFLHYWMAWDRYG